MYYINKSLLYYDVGLFCSFLFIYVFVLLIKCLATTFDGYREEPSHLRKDEKISSYERCQYFTIRSLFIIQRHKQKI